MATYEQAQLTQLLHELEQRKGGRIHLGLAHLDAIFEQFGLQAMDCPVITVAGTNGKGSCVAALEAILQAHGWRTAVYTSPHLIVFNERVRFNQRMISDQAMLEALSSVQAYPQSDDLSYFEIITVAALLWLKSQSPDIMILEIGLGGRLDIVNKVEPDVSIITQVALDHQEWLGNNRESVGREKAGVFRAGKTAICGDPQPPQSVMEIAEALGANLCCIGQDFVVEEGMGAWHYVDSQHNFQQLARPNLALSNMACAIKALLALNLEPMLSVDTLRSVFSELQLPGRFQRMHVEGRLYVFDVAHNPAAAELLANNLQRDFAGVAIRAVFSALADKDLLGIVAPLKDIVNEWYVAPNTYFRTATGEQLQQTFNDTGISAYQVLPNLALAMDMAHKQCKSDELVIVFGSFYTVSDACKHIGIDNYEH